MLFALSLSWGASGCSNDLDSLYCKTDCSPDRGSGGSSTGGTNGDGDDGPGGADPGDGDGKAEEESPPPILPFLPDDKAIEDCTQCVRDKCKAEREGCLEDDACTAQLRCTGECSDPGCLEECRGTVGGDTRSPFGTSPFHWELSRCAFFSCPLACQSGHNWECVGAYQWPQAEESRVESYVRFGTGEYPWDVAASGIRDSLAGARVKVCYNTLDCGDAAVSLDAAQGAALTLSTRGGAGLFEGYFELRSGQPSLFTVPQRIYTLPRSFGGDFEPFYFPGLALLDGGISPAADLATIVAVKLDCTGWPSSAPAQAVASRSAGEELLAEAPQEGRSAVAVFLNVPLDGSSSPLGETPRATWTVRLVGEGESEPWSRQAIEVSPGWATTVPLLPRSVGQ
jgi:hypothetical protein